ncbi:MAG: alkaline phosphatase family protein [Candidatus Cybelea sp.]
MRKVFASRPTLTAAVLMVFLSACSGNGNLSPSANPPFAKPQDASTLVEQLSGSDTKIAHVIIIIQENRSFDNLFQGFPGADTQSYGYTTSGKKIKLQPVGLQASWDVEHDSYGFFAACNGQGSYPGTDCLMNGFDNEYYSCGHSSQTPCPNANPPYSYVPHRETEPYFAMGEQYVLADRMFASNFDASSFVSHQYIIAAQANSRLNYPSGAWGCEGSPSDNIATVTQQRTIGNNVDVCLNDKTLGDELDKAGISWRFYTSEVYTDGGEWSPYSAVKHIYYGKDWSKDVITPQTQFFTDVSHGKLPVVSWITPTCENSDHAGCGSDAGPSWVASLVNAVGESQYWKSTAIFVFWDDYGGWYDHVPPKLVDYDGLGFRLPLLIISPYAKQGYVSHVHYEHGSILKFIEDRFALPRLSASDKRATSPEKDCFDFAQSPRSFKRIPSRYGMSYFIHQPLDRRPVDGE